MTPQDTLVELLKRLEVVNQGIVYINEYELNQWPTQAVDALKAQKLIVKASMSSSAICHGCERNCIMPVYSPPIANNDSVFFIVCGKRYDINRVSVSPDQIIQWQISLLSITTFIAKCLSLPLRNKKLEGGIVEIGIVTGNQRAQMLCIKTLGEIVLIAGSNSIPITQAIRFDTGHYMIDKKMILCLVDASTTTDVRYTPNKAKNESRKERTKERRASWKIEYKRIKKENPSLGDRDCSQKIADSLVGKGYGAETIRRYMKS